jgi:hypothetical protein
MKRILLCELRKALMSSWRLLVFHAGVDGGRNDTTLHACAVATAGRVGIA